MTAAVWSEVIVGGGIAGLTCAWESARAGRSVLLLEASERFGGPVGLMELTPRPGHAGRPLPEGLRVEYGAESFATKNPVVPRLLGDLGLAEDEAPVSPAGSWIVDAPAGDSESLRALPSPKLSLFGIPADLASPDVLAFLGEDDAAEAARLDALPLDGRLCEPGVSIGRLVRERMGESVLSRLVTPVVAGVYSAAPDDMEAARLHPRLLELLRERGSLASAVAELRRGMAAGAAVAGLTGGMGRLTEELVGRARAEGAELRPSAKVIGLQRESESRFGVVVRSARGESEERILAEKLTVAVPAGPGRELLASLAPELIQERRAELEAAGFQQGERIVLVTLACAAGTESARALATAPRGSGLLVAPSARGERLSLAKALTHSSQKWDWLRERLGGAEVIRLSYNEPDLTAAGYSVDDVDRLVERAAADASLIMGVEIELGDVAATGLAVHRNTAPLMKGTDEAAESAAQSVHPAERLDALLQHPRLDGVRVVGSWRAGTGLVAVVSQARSSRF